MRERPHNPSEFLSSSERKKVEDAIAAAEKTTSAEIKFIIARHCLGDIRDKAASLFHQNRLDQTELRNAVLILLVTTNHEFLIFGDEGIHSKVGDTFWQDVRDTMSEQFRHDAFSDGLCLAIGQIGDKLGEHFPIQQNDVNEIANEVVTEE